MEIHFEKIREKIIEEISAAKFNVYAAVAWVGEKNILYELANSLKRGVQVEIIINDDERFHDFKHKFTELIELGGKVLLYDTKTSLMHNKFCIVDLCTTITGSFNWSYGATFHQENIIIERNNIEVAHTFATQFIKLKKNSTLFTNQISNNVELAHKVKVKTVTGYSDDIDGSGFIVLLEEGKRWGSLYLHAPFGQDASFIPSEIHGFWKSRVPIEEFNPLEDDKDYYEFVCIDPYLVKYLK